MNYYNIAYSVAKSHFLNDEDYTVSLLNLLSHYGESVIDRYRSLQHLEDERTDTKLIQDLEARINHLEKKISQADIAYDVIVEKASAKILELKTRAGDLKASLYLQSVIYKDIVVENERFRESLKAEKAKPQFDAEKVYSHLEDIVHHRFMAGYSQGHGNQAKYQDHYDKADTAFSAILDALELEQDTGSDPPENPEPAQQLIDKDLLLTLVRTAFEKGKANPGVETALLFGYSDIDAMVGELLGMAPDETTV